MLPVSLKKRESVPPVVNVVPLVRLPPLRHDGDQPMRDFLIQRYCAENWPQVRGLAPFIATGPDFAGWTIPNSLSCYREYRFRKPLREGLLAVRSGANDVAREAIAELLLREGIVSALWSIDSTDVLPESERWAASVRQV